MGNSRLELLAGSAKEKGETQKRRGWFLLRLCLGSCLFGMQKGGVYGWLGLAWLGLAWLGLAWLGCSCGRKKQTVVRNACIILRRSAIAVLHSVLPLRIGRFSCSHNVRTLMVLTGDFHILVLMQSHCMHVAPRRDNAKDVLVLKSIFSTVSSRREYD